MRRLANSTLGRATLNMAQGLFLSALMVGCERALHYLVGLSLPPGHPAWQPLEMTSKVSLVGCATLITTVTGLEVTILSIRSLRNSFRQMRDPEGE